MTAPTPASALVRPFTVSIPEAGIDDLKQRLARTRWPDPETVSDWSQGVRVENARSLADYWARGYDWRRVAGLIPGAGVVLGPLALAADATAAAVQHRSDRQRWYELGPEISRYQSLRSLEASLKRRKLI